MNQMEGQNTQNLANSQAQESRTSPDSTSLAPTQTQPQTPAQISPSFGSNNNKQEETPVNIPKSQFIKGYNYKFFIIIFIVISATLGALYFSENPFGEFIKAAADSIKSSVFKTNISNITGKPTTNAVKSATTVRSGTTITNEQLQNQTVYSATPGGSYTYPLQEEDDSPMTENQTSTPTSNETETAAEECIGSGQQLAANESRECCPGLRPIPLKSASNNTSMSISYVLFCM